MKKLEQFWFRYYSQATVNNDNDNWLRYVTAIVLFIPAAIAVILDVLGGNGTIPIIIFILLMVLFSITWIVVYFYHNWRIRHDR